MRIETILDNISDAVMVLDRDWVCCDVNHRTELLVRQRRDDLVGRNYWDIFPDVLGTPAESDLRRAHEDRVIVDFEQFLPSIYAWHQVRAIPADGQLLLLSRDITDRMRMMRDEAVRAGIRQVIEHVPIAVTILRGPELRVEMQNAMGRSLLLGRNIEGLTIRSAVPEIEGQGLFEILEEVYRTGSPFEGRELPVTYEPVLGKGLRQAYFNVIYQPIFDTSGQIDGVIALSLDVTELVLEKQRIQHLAAERDAVLQQLVEGVILTDAEGRITFVNDAATRLHGVAQLDVTPDNYTTAYNLLREDGSPFPTEELPLVRAVRDNETVIDARWRIRRPDGTEVLVTGNARPVLDDRGDRIAAVLTIRPAENGVPVSP